MFGMITFMGLDHLNYINKENENWLMVYGISESVLFLLMVASYFPNLKIKNVLHPLSVLITIRIELNIIQTIYFFNKDDNQGSLN